jgi:hypothetical protein
MPYIIKSNTTVPDGVVQIKDLWPSKTHANAVIDPKPYGFRYINGPQNTALTSFYATANAFNQECSGLSAYIICNIGGALATAMSLANANAWANSIIARAVAGQALALANINAVKPGGVDDAAAGDVANILSILAGASYVVPAGHVFQAAGVFVPAATDFFVNNEARMFDSSFYISNAIGDISVMKSDAFVYLDTTATPPANTTGALVTIYADDGTLA